MNSSFYSPEEAMNQSVQAQLEAIKNFKPPVEIDPSTIKADNVKMTMAEKAFMLAKKYRFDDPSYTLKNIWHKHKKRQMNERTIEIVLEIVAEIKATNTGLV